MIDNRKLIVLLLLLAPTSATNGNSTIDGVANNVCSYTEHVNVTFLSVNVIACNDNEGT